MSDDLTSSVKCVRTTHLTDDFKGLVIIYREGGAGANRGWATIFYAWLKGEAIKKYANVLPAKMLKASSGCHQKMQPIKIALYNNFY